MNVDPLFIHAGVFLLMLLVLQVALLMLGISGPEIPDGPDVDVDTDIDADMDADSDVPSGGLIDSLGLRGVPLIIWISAWMSGFSISGFMLSGLFSVEDSSWIVRGLAILFGFAFARVFSRMIVRTIPNVTTSAISITNARSLMGEVTDGVASLNRPARVEVYDGKGGVHYFMAEPQNPEEQFVAGEKVALILITNPETGARERRIVKI